MKNNKYLLIVTITLNFFCASLYAQQNRMAFEHFSIEEGLSQATILCILQDSRGFIWIGTFDGLNKYDGYNFTVYKEDIDDTNSLSNNTVSSVYEDRSGVIWIGTDNGLNQYDRQADKFKRYMHNPADTNSLSSNKIRSIYEDRTGKLWIGTYGGGLIKFDPQKNQFQHYKHDANNPNSLSNDFVYRIYGDTSGVLWIGTYGGGLNKFDLQKEQFTHYKHDANNPSSLSGNDIFSIYEDKSRVLWIGTYGGGLNKFDRQKEQFKHYKHDAKDPNSLSSDAVYMIYEDKSGTLWVGTLNGLNRFDREQQQFKYLRLNTNYPNRIVTEAVYSIYEDRLGTLWIGTSNGLYKINQQDEQINRFGEKEGLLNRVIYGILEDERGNIWLSTNRGISKLNRQTERFKNYSLEDGLQSNEFNFGAYYKNSEGEMFFGGIGGMNIFHPDSINDNQFIPPVVITGFKIFNKAVPIDVNEGNLPSIPRHISELDEIRLSHKESVFTFEFSALAYSAPEKNLYAYTMVGFDKEWYYANASRRFATYTNLDAGEYTFKVKGSNKDGVWNEEGTSIKITITPPPWKTWWSYSLYILIITSTIVGFFYWRTYSVRKRKEELEIEVDNRTRELKSTQSQLIQSEKMASLGQLTAGVAHEINNPINFVKGGSAALSNDFRDLIKLIDMFSNKYSEEDIDAFKKEIDLDYLLENVPLTIDDIKTGADRVADIVKGLRSFARLDEGEKQKVDIHECIDAILLLISEEDTGHIELVKNYQADIKPLSCYLGQLNQAFLNIINNARDVMNDGGKLTITTEENNEYISIRFKDTGPGIPDDIKDKIFDPFFTTKDVGEGTGLGLAITHGIMEKHGGKIEVKSEEEHGSEFVITLPISTS